MRDVALSEVVPVLTSQCNDYLFRMESIMFLALFKSSLLKVPTGLLFASLAVAAPCFGQAEATDGSPRMIMTSAHRGEHAHHPENSIPAIQGAIDAGMDYVEIDVRTTSDGQLVLMHDPQSIA
jgi:glycerophosphoryl diester phosphodiesterase